VKLFITQLLLVGVIVMATATTSYDVNATEADRASSKTLSLLFNGVHLKEGWEVTNDGVMGGLSYGCTRIENNSLIFYGKISIENNGGFSSVFKRLPTRLKNTSSITIVLEGDGKPYQLRVRSKVMGYELAYKVDFETTANTRKTYTFSLADFEASFRGRIINNAPELTADVISHIGFLLASKQAGDFSLSIHSIDFL
jgi:hypothetical protein